MCSTEALQIPVAKVVQFYKSKFDEGAQIFVQEGQGSVEEAYSLAANQFEDMIQEVASYIDKSKQSLALMKQLTGGWRFTASTNTGHKFSYGIVIEV